MTLSPLLGEHDLPCSVEVGSVDLPIDSDFRCGIRFEMLMYDDAVPDATKVALALSLYFGGVPAGVDIGDAIAAMLLFYRCGKPESPSSEHDGKQLYSYSHDYDLIYAAFRAVYGIDLFDPSTRIHWWRFRSMFAALPGDCQLMRVIGYRAARPERWMSKEQRAQVNKMRRLFALPARNATPRRRIETEEDHERMRAEIAEAKRQMREGSPCPST